MSGVVFTVAELDRRMGIPGVARVSEGNGGLPRVQVNGSFGEGEVYIHGAQVTSWKPAGDNEVLFVSTKSRFVSPGFAPRWMITEPRRMDLSVPRCGSSSPLSKTPAESQ